MLPGALKACVLCNGTASFYSLPELSPAFPGKEPTGVQWIGGYDENIGRDDRDGTALMIATTRRVLQVKIGDRLRAVKPNIEYPSCLAAARRGTIACVANGSSYALLEIQDQQKIPLFDISTATEHDVAQQDAQHFPPAHQAGHGRSRSLGDFASNPAGDSTSSAPSNLNIALPYERVTSPGNTNTSDSGSGSRPRSSTAETSPAPPVRPYVPAQSLKPHVLSPFADEFLLTTGTSMLEPGVGVFVNTEGDVVSRGALEFDSYPQAVIACSFTSSQDIASASDDVQWIIALLSRQKTSTKVDTLQLQRLSPDTSQTHDKITLDVGVGSPELISPYAGLCHSIDIQNHVFTELAELLQAVRYRPFSSPKNSLDADPRTKSSIDRLEQENALFETHVHGSGSPSPEYDEKRSQEEFEFVARLGRAVTSAMVWSGSNLWHLLPNPLLLQLERQILQTSQITEDRYDFSRVEVAQVLSFLGRVRDREPQSEVEFLSIKYAQQKASSFLFLHLLSGMEANGNLKAACKLAESALIDSELDPRIVLSLLPPLAYEVIHGKTGIWIQQGIVDCLDDFQSPVNAFEHAPMELWFMVRHYLTTWQEKRGASGSISDEKAVFDTVDAALLHLLLYLDKVTASSEGQQAPIRAKLNNVVDHWKGDFDRAVNLLEHYKRLFLLSRLYQSRKSSRDVLRTWERICDGEENHDNVSTDYVYVQMRKYLPLLRDTSIVQKYSIWLAQRSPDLGVQLLADDSSRVKFVPAEVLALLKEHAPGAVQLFLEHLVFARNLDQYADDLVGYYLDSVLNVLEHSEDARQSLADSYTTYRALSPPKPTYFNFIQENAPDEPWWQSRLRLLQLLGTGGYATTTGQSRTLTYSIDVVLERLKPFTQYLVSESIILDARQGRHQEALKLLVHGLGDHDTAIRYCYFGGPSSSTGTIDASALPPRAQQQEHFRVLLSEFLVIPDEEERLDRSSHLLGTFATWFDPITVLETVPDFWSVSLLAEFLLRTFRAATTERSQAIIIKALSAAQNLQKQADFIAICEKMGAKLEHANNDQADTTVSTDIPIS